MAGASRHEADRVQRRPCCHIALTHPVEPHSTGCQECQARGDDWVQLWLCLSCGWVACSNGSPNRHAKAHYEETDHPIAVPLQPYPGPRWCYIHQREV
jgi:uncharacterized UBP type Zn finger protein